LTLENEGGPLWDGAATLKVSPASELEIEGLEGVEIDDGKADRPSEEDWPLIVFLMDVVGSDTPPDDE
jgi:hypothetical protein